MALSARAVSQPPEPLPACGERYNALMQIGSGGMARVFVAIQHGPLGVKRLVVIKQIRQEVIDDTEYIRMFVDEARLAVRLNHPNVVHTYDVLDGPAGYGLVMEFLDGPSLLHLLNRVGRKRFPLHDHIWIISRILAGLHYAHELRDLDGTPLNLVHRDVTPSNIVVCRSGAVKLLDFGIAKAEGAEAATRAGILKGKIGYVSPEQCTGHRADRRSDIYAVGVMLWEAIAQRRRLMESTLAAQVQARTQGLEPALEHVCPDTPEALVKMARRALSLEPDERYPSAKLFQRELELYLARVGSRAGTESVGHLVDRHFRRERIALRHALSAGLRADPAHTDAKTPLVPHNDEAGEQSQIPFNDEQGSPPWSEGTEPVFMGMDHVLLRPASGRNPLSQGTGSWWGAALAWAASFRELLPPWLSGRRGVGIVVVAALFLVGLGFVGYHARQAEPRARARSVEPQIIETGRQEALRPPPELTEPHAPPASAGRPTSPWAPLRREPSAPSPVASAQTAQQAADQASAEVQPSTPRPMAAPDQRSTHDPRSERPSHSAPVGRGQAPVRPAEDEPHAHAIELVPGMDLRAITPLRPRRLIDNRSPWRR